MDLMVRASFINLVKITMSTPTTQIILGIDPGTVVMGYGIIRVQGQKVSLVDLGVLKPGKAKDGIKRLQIIHVTISGLVRQYKPTEFAIEAPFFGKNVQSMLKLGRAQGVAMAAALQYGLPVTEYAPKKVKQSVTGNGNATKEQVARMLQTIFKIEESPDHYDATDALAVAFCHHLQSGSGWKPPATTSKKKSTTTKGKRDQWAAFISKNAERIRK
jgi:crossover junction endodeoxyribonuclease RuvC